jgi:hypothetical protein
MNLLECLWLSQGGMGNIIPTTNFSHKIICKRSSWKKMENFVDNCWNCWQLNSQLVQNYLLSQPLDYYYKYTTKNKFCIFISQMLKSWKFIFEIA